MLAQVIPSPLETSAVASLTQAEAWKGILPGAADGIWTILNSYYVNKMSCHVDFDLTEADLQAFFESTEELTMLDKIVDVDDDPHQVVRIDLFIVPPTPSNDLSFP